MAVKYVHISMQNFTKKKNEIFTFWWLDLDEIINFCIYHLLSELSLNSLTLVNEKADINSLQLKKYKNLNKKYW